MGSEMCIRDRSALHRGEKRDVGGGIATVEHDRLSAPGLPIAHAFEPRGPGAPLGDIEVDHRHSSRPCGLPWRGGSHWATGLTWRYGRVVRIIPAQLTCSKRWLHIAQWNRQIFQGKVLFGIVRFFAVAPTSPSDEVAKQSHGPLHSVIL